MTQIAAGMFGLACLLALIAALPPIAARLRLPGTVLLALLGIGLGLTVEAGGHMVESGVGKAVFGEFLHALSSLEIPTDAFLAVFLPILLFESSIQIDSRDLLDDIVSVLVLAILAVIITTVVAGSAVWAVSGTALVACLLLGAIIATTDPVAVIQVFREVGAPRRLSSLVEGESLLNDAAAIALFGLFASILTGSETQGASGVVISFAWDFLGGALFGAIAGRAGSLVLGRLDDTGPAEITASVALAYLVYSVADHLLGVSGVVAVVAAGLVFGNGGRNRVAPEAWARLGSIWEQLAFWAASLIFVLASMLVPDVLASATGHDLVLLVVLTASALGARAITLYAVLPLLGRVFRSERIRLDFRHVMLWGGLRGAVTLALALAVGENAAIPEDARHLVTVLAAGFVLFTLLVQATTLRPLISALGLNRLSPLERLVRDRALRLTRAEVGAERREQAESLGLQTTDLRSPVLADEPAPAEAGQREQLTGALLTLTRREIELCREALARHLVSRRVAARAIRESYALLDAVRARGPLAWHHTARRQLGIEPTLRFAARVHRATGWSRPLARVLAERFEALMLRRQVQAGLMSFLDDRLAGLFGADVATTLRHMLEDRQAETERSLEALRLQYPDYGRMLATRLVDRAALRRETEAYARMLDEGLLTAQVHRGLEAELQARRRELDRVPPLDVGLDVARMLARVPLLAGLPAEAREDLRAQLTTRLAFPGERIVRRGEAGDAMFFVASGAVEVILPGSRPRLGSGAFFGEIALVQRSPRIADVTALGFCELLVLSAAAFQEFLTAHPEQRHIIETEARRRLGATA